MSVSICDIETTNSSEALPCFTPMQSNRERERPRSRKETTQKTADDRQQLRQKYYQEFAEYMEKIDKPLYG